MKFTIKSLKEYTKALFDYGESYCAFKRRPRIFGGYMLENRKKALLAYKALRREIRKLAKTEGK